MIEAGILQGLGENVSRRGREGFAKVTKELRGWVAYTVGQMPEETPNPLLSEPEVVEPVEAAGRVEDAPIGVDAPAGRRGAAAFIFLTVTLDMLAMGMIMPVLPRLIEGFMAGDASTAARMLGWFGTLFAGMQFFFSPVLGSLSDRFGRRPVVLLSNFGMGLDYVVMALAPTLPWLFLGRVVSGLTASSVPTAMAYMADVTPKEKRAGAFGMLNAAFGLGFVLGPALGGVLGNVNPRLPFWVAAGLSLANGMYGLFVLPESLGNAQRSAFSWKRANPVGSLRLFLSAKGLLPLAGVLVLGYTAQQVLVQVYVIYADTRFGWSDRTVGLSLAVVGVSTILYGALLVKPAVAKLGERRAMIFGYVGAAIGYAMFGASKTGLLLWLGIPVLNLMGVAWPAAQSTMSRLVPANQQGHLQGAVNSLRGIAGLIGPGMFTWVFSISVGAHALVPTPGSPFYLASGLVVVGIGLIVFGTRNARVTAAEG
jgi:DHA1 family tetracycline resistance protein-like MFS transporter